MMRKNSKKVNPYLLTTSVTVIVIVVMSIIKLMTGEGFDLTETLVNAVIFWIFYFLGFQLFTRLIVKRKK
jgi:predicted Na+-dependent transporter